MFFRASLLSSRLGWTGLAASMESETFPLRMMLAGMQRTWADLPRLTGRG